MKTNQIESTKDYSIFQEIASNREVNRLHVKRLMESIEEKNLLHLFPISVNGKMEVIDGQHRLAAAKKLKIAIYYMVDDSITKQDISIMNRIKKNWTLMDYINYYTIEKRTEYQKLSRILSKYSEIGASTILSLLSDQGKRRTDEIKEGTWGMEQEEHAIKVLDILFSFKDRYSFYTDRSLVFALNIAIKSGQYDHAHFLQKLELQPRSFVKCVDTKQYLQMIEEIYNYHSSKNKVRFT